MPLHLREGDWHACYFPTKAALQDGRVPFHILGLKCPHCLSYNTRRLSIDRDGAPPLRGAQAGQA